jgi:replication-associated recombination protein RarA
MSHECTHDEARKGNFVLHTSGCIYYGPPAQPKTTLVSWLEMGDREYSFPAFMANSEADKGRRLAAKCDSNKAVGKPFAGLTNGEFVADENGNIFWGAPEPPKTHHVSWIDDNGRRVFAPLLAQLCGKEEIQQCEELANVHDKAVT